jgi:N-acetylneuraminic acid mutarotase
VLQASRNAKATLVATSCIALMAASEGQAQAAGAHNVWKEVAPVTNSDGAYAYEGAAGDPTSGLVYLVGGANNYNTSAGVESYSPATNEWTAVVPLPEPMGDEAVAAGQKGLLFALGGWQSDETSAINTVYAYSPSRKLWITEPSMPIARSGSTAATGPDGRVYVMGGLDASYNYVTEVDVFNPTTMSWSTVASPPGNVGTVAVTGSDGRIYAFGAGTTSSTPVYAYDVYTNVWASVANLPEPYLECAAEASDGRIYAVESTLKAPRNANATTPTFAYQPSANKWTKVASMPWRWQAVCASIPSQPHIYAMAGASLQGYYPHPQTTNTVLQYTS